MSSRRSFLKTAALLPPLVRTGMAQADAASELDPRGKIHIPIGIANTLDTLKTFVEAEGNFSPGFGSYGIYFWLLDRETGKLAAPTMDEISVEHGLGGEGLLIPWSRWRVGDLEVETEVCEVRRESPRGELFVVGSRLRLTNKGSRRRRVGIYAALRPLGAAGCDVKNLEVGEDGDSLLVDGHTAIVADRSPSQAGALPTDTIGNLALAGEMPATKNAKSTAGDCSGALRFDIEIGPNVQEEFGFVCPVLPGRSVARHDWVDLKQNAMVDQAPLNPPDGGIPQPDPGTGYYRSIRVGDLFREAEAYWRGLVGGLKIETPDPRWGESMRAILSHAALCMNEGAADVAVINYNVFNRDGMYIANIMQKSGLAELSSSVLDYFVTHPFNGRAYPEADNPGQILWAIHQHWLLTRDREWLKQIFPSVKKIAEMIRYYRTAPAPHWVNMTSLEFGEALPESQRQLLKPGSCDGFHPEYTEAFDVTGLRSAAELADALGSKSDAADWKRLARTLFATYDEKFGEKLPEKYGSYSVLWPCRLYPLDQGKGYEQFRGVGEQHPKSWRYFPLATAHQGLLAGNREAGCRTLNTHLDHPQMRGWYALDEGGGSGSGGWHKVRTNWTHSKERPGDNRAVAMPHGWAIAEFWLLLRDSLVFEQSGRLVLLAGVPAEWFRKPEGIQFAGLQTYFGSFGLSYKPGPDGMVLTLSGDARPPEGFVLRLPNSIDAVALLNGRELTREPNGDYLLPSEARRAEIRL